MTLTINDLLQTLKNRLNRSVVHKLNVEQLNAVIDRFVNGGRVVEDSDLELFLNPPVVVEALEEPISTDEIIVPSPEVEAALQSLADDAQAMGLYDMKYDVSTPSIATPLTMDELVEVAELQKELAMTNEQVQAEIDSGKLIPLEGSDTHFFATEESAVLSGQPSKVDQDALSKILGSTIVGEVNVGHGQLDGFVNLIEAYKEATDAQRPTELPESASDDSAVTESTETPEITKEEEAANVESEQS